MNERRTPGPRPAAAAAPSAPEELDFETAMARLEQIVRELDSGEQSLDAAISGRWPEGAAQVGLGREAT